MKIVQTFWSGGRNPLEHSYGWPHAEYNLMSWTLSCLSLRQHYDRVELYTDRRGYELLIGKLHLPYTQVHVVYDDDLCLPQHWAYAKIKTYSLQTEPFLHIDGDMYFPQPLPEELLSAPLAAQNREIGTAYYQGMLNRVLAHPEFVLPGFIQDTLSQGTMASYNMGIFGGTDLDFIHRYCQQVFDFFEVNHMNDPAVQYSNEECNVFFEQIFLAAMVDKEGRMVQGLIPSSIIDNGYKNRDFANLKCYEERYFFHVLGGMKGRRDNCRHLAKALLRTEPDRYWDICSIYQEARTPVDIADDKQSGIFHYKMYIWDNLVKWANINKDKLRGQEICSAQYKRFVNAEDKQAFIIRRAEYGAIYKVPDCWSEADLKLLRARLACPDIYHPRYVGLVPVSNRIGYEEFYLTEDEVELLSVVDTRSMSVRELLLIMIEKSHVAKEGPTIRRRLLHIYEKEICKLVECGMLLTGKQNTDNIFV